MNEKIIYILLIVAIILLASYAFKLLNTTPHDYQTISNSMTIYRINTSMDTTQPSVEISPALISSGIFSKTNNYNECTFLTFQSVNSIEQDLQKIKYHKNLKYVFAFQGLDTLANKKIFTQTLNKNGLQEYIPKTWLLNDEKEIKQYLGDSSKQNIIILKNNAQQQKGLNIINSWDDKAEYSKKYVIAQELLQNPLLIAGHKINIRIYLMIFIQNGEIKTFFFNNGFIYYAPSKWRYNTTLADVNITTGLGDRKLYEENPLTYQDLKNVLKQNEFDTLQKNLYTLMKNVIGVYKDNLVKKNSNKKNITYAHVMGCDIAPESDYKVKIMEINKGPDLRFKDVRDKEVKQNLCTDFQNYLITKTVSEQMIEI